ncbi:hypothetical protein EBZ39_02585 [bacterium]|nr:hypothetical protein [bacterium]
MSQERIYPFRRISVDHMVRGVTRVWWQLESQFREPGPYVFQLQYGYTPIKSAVDWQNVGDPVTNGYFALDPGWREGGMDLLTHYRVTLTTPDNIYVSQAANCLGELTERDWLLSREIIRKEQLRHRLVSVPGYLIKQYRYGKPCSRCRDELTQEVTDDNCKICAGTGFEVGYHPPLALQCWDLAPTVNAERVDTEVKGATRENAYTTARVIGFPALSKRDIWVNGSTDERWVIDQIKVAATIRNVPVVYEVTMGLLPFNNTVYNIEVGGEPAHRDPRPIESVEGCGDIIVDSNYGGDDSLAYIDATGYAVEGANVYVFKQADVDAAAPSLPNRDLAVAQTSTVANGRWGLALKLFAGTYSVLYEKLGEYGPDLKPLTVVPVAPIQIAPPPSPKPTKAVEDFWNI